MNVRVRALVVPPYRQFTTQATIYTEVEEPRLHPNILRGSVWKKKTGAATSTD